MKRYTSSLIYFAIIFLSLVLTLLDVHYFILQNIYITPRNSLEFLLWLAPYWFLPPRYRRLIVIPAWAFGLWGWINMSYFAFWGTFVPASALSAVGNINPELILIGFSLLSWKALILLAAAMLLPVTLFFIPGALKEPPFTRVIKLCVLSASILLFLCCQTYNYTTTKDAHKTWGDYKYTLARHLSCEDNPSDYYRITSQGTTLFILSKANEAISPFITNYSLSENKRAVITDFLNSYSATEDLFSDSVKQKNVVFIIVESLNSEVIDAKINGVEITPVLNRLSKAEGTVFCPRVVSQIKDGASSDGHFLLLSGLLPLNNGVTAVRYGSINTFPSLSRILSDHHNTIVMATDGRYWQEAINFKSAFGMDNIIKFDDKNPECWIDGRDGWMFREAEKVVDTIRSPFFLVLETMSMHVPFIQKNVDMPNWIKSATTIDENTKNYCTVTNYFDRELGKFLEKLPAETMVILASDHAQTNALLDKQTSTQPDYPFAVYMALNTDTTMRVDRIVGQVNLYPTTLRLLRRHLPGYTGIAPSVFDPSVNGTMTSRGEIVGKPSQAALDTLRNALRYSDMIIRSDYFKGKY